MKVWEIVVTVSAVVATLTTLMVNISKIQQHWGSIKGWVFNRAAIKLEAQRKAGESIKQINNIADTVDTLSESVNKIFKTLKEAEETDRLLIRAKIIEITDKISRRGFEYPHEVDDLNELVEKYHKLGGNGAVDSRMERIRDLEIKHLREPWEWSQEEEGNGKK